MPTPLNFVLPVYRPEITTSHFSSIKDYRSLAFSKKETGERINLVKFEYDAGRNFVQSGFDM
jgi:hypothetical protein